MSERAEGAAAAGVLTDDERRRIQSAVGEAQMAAVTAALTEVADKFHTEAVERFATRGPHDVRGAAFWDASVWIREQCLPAVQTTYAPAQPTAAPSAAGGADGGAGRG